MVRWRRPRAAILRISLIAAGALAAAPAVAPAAVSAPEGRLAYILEHEGPPQCYSPPCTGDDDLEPGEQYEWIETVRADGSDRRALTPTGPASNRGRWCRDGQPRFLGTPRISPDGRLIARGFCHKVLIERLDRHVVQTLRVPGDAVGLAWAPDGRRLAVQTYNSPGDTDRLYVVDRKDGSHRSIADWAGSSVSWSPRYDLIAFWEVPTGHTIVARSNGHVVHRIERGETYGFDLSPLDRRIAYPCKRGACVERVDGTHRHVLTGRCTHDPLGSVAWSPDGRSLACLGPGGVIAVDLKTDQVRLIRHLSRGETYEYADDLDWGPAPAPAR
jgi:dipeptidyl aminopeptidase/acylaminoacyl peptidase